MKFRTYVLFFLLFGVLADVTLGLTLLKDAPLLWKLMMAAPTLAALVCLPLIGTGTVYTDALRLFSFLIFIFELPKFLVALNGLFLPAAVAVGIGIAVSAFFTVFIFYVSRHLKVKHIRLAFKDLPEGFDGIRLCHISDLHLGSLGHKTPYVKRIVDAIMEQQPELILFSGDLVSFQTREADAYKPWLEQLAAPMGIYSIFGNHDFLLHGPNDEKGRKEDMEKLEAFEKGLGWRVLRNRTEILERGGSRVALVGVDNVSRNPYFQKTGGQNLETSLAGLPEGIFKLLLSHDATHWRMEVLSASDIALTLSGHTHGLKYKLTGLHPSHWKLPESAGIYREGERVLHVSPGLGSGIAFRLGGYPEIDMITLTKN